GEAVNTLSMLWDGSPIEGPGGLRDALMARKEMFVETFIEKMMTYALGRRVEYFDMPAIRQVAAAASKDDFKMSAIVQGIVDTAAFRMRTKENEQAQVTQASNAVQVER